MRFLHRDHRSVYCDLYVVTISMCFVIAHTVSNGQSEMQIHVKITYFFSSYIFKLEEYKVMVLYELHSLKTVYVIWRILKLWQCLFSLILKKNSMWQRNLMENLKPVSDCLLMTTKKIKCDAIETRNRYSCLLFVF